MRAQSASVRLSPPQPASVRQAPCLTAVELMLMPRSRSIFIQSVVALFAPRRARTCAAVPKQCVRSRRSPSARDAVRPLATPARRPPRAPRMRRPLPAPHARAAPRLPGLVNGAPIEQQLLRQRRLARVWVRADGEAAAAVDLDGQVHGCNSGF